MYCLEKKYFFWNCGQESPRIASVHIYIVAFIITSILITITPVKLNICWIGNSINMMIFTFGGVSRSMPWLSWENVFSGIAARKAPRIASGTPLAEIFAHWVGFSHQKSFSAGKKVFFCNCGQESPRIASATPFAGILTIVCNAHLDWEVYAGSNMQNIGPVARGWFIRNIALATPGWHK